MCSVAAGAADLVNLSVEIDGWTLMPIAENGATTHIIATRNDDETLTTDIDIVLYEKTATGWSGSAYDPSVTKEDAMIDLADEFGLSDPFGGDWHIDLDAVDVLDHVLPRVGFGKGFFVTDPLYVIAHQVDDPEPLAEGAEQSGLSAASGAANTGSISSGSGGGSDSGPPQSTDCGCDACIQDSIAAGVDASLSDPTLDLDAIELIAYAESQNFISCCIPWTWTVRTNPWSSWFCQGAWVYTGPASTSGCNWERTATRQQTRKRKHRTAGCTVCTWTQFRSESGTITTTTLRDPTTGVCNTPTGCGTPTSVDDRQDWTPPSPC